MKLFVDVNKSISEQNKDIQAKKNTPNPISINVFQEFQAIIKRILEQTKNRKPEPAVKEHFRKFPFYLFLRLFSCNQAVWLYCKLWLVCHAAVWFDVVPALACSDEFI